MLHGYSVTRLESFWSLTRIFYEFSKNVVTNWKLKFFGISVISPTCFGCFLPSFTDNRLAILKVWPWWQPKRFSWQQQFCLISEICESMLLSYIDGGPEPRFTAFWETIVKLWVIVFVYAKRLETITAAHKKWRWIGEVF